MKKLFLLLLLSTQSSWGTSVTVSGISSGAYMAQQFHIAYSSVVTGAALLAGGPYYCSQGVMLNTINSCMHTYWGAPSAARSVLEIQSLAKRGLIDPVENISRARVYVLAGTEDKTVKRAVSDALVTSYKMLGVGAEKIHYETDLSVGHAFPTEDYGNPCRTPGKSPYISNCGRDVAGEILQHLYGKLKAKGQALTGNYYSFPQFSPNDIHRPELLSMRNEGYAYIPGTCLKKKNCRIHLAFHGCQQTVDDIQDTYFTKTGLNHWAETNKLIIIYPQAKKNLFMNPNGCWDWWGYSSVNFHNNEGPQLKVVARIIEALLSGELQLKKIRD